MHSCVRGYTCAPAPTLESTSVVRELAKLGQYREFWLSTLSRHRIHVRYRQSVLGGLWAILQPLAMMVVFTAVFSHLGSGTDR